MFLNFKFKVDGGMISSSSLFTSRGSDAIRVNSPEIDGSGALFDIGNIGDRESGESCLASPAKIKTRKERHCHWKFDEESQESAMTMRVLVLECSAPVCLSCLPSTKSGRSATIAQYCTSIPDITHNGINVPNTIDGVPCDSIRIPNFA